MSLLDRLKQVRTDLHAAEAANPGSPELAALHRSLTKALKEGTPTLLAAGIAQDDIRAMNTNAGGEPKGDIVD